MRRHDRHRPMLFTTSRRPSAPHPLRRFRWPIIFLIIIIVYGVAGYMILQKWSFLDSLYMTIITLSTVGFTEVHPLSDVGRYFTISLIVVGVAVLGYTVGIFVETLTDGELLTYRRRRRMIRQIDALHDHFIVCGFGRTGTQVCAQLVSDKIPFVVIEHNEESLIRLRATSYPFIEGNATTDAVLLEAGVQRARGLISASDADAQQVYIILSARVLNPQLFIVARAGQLESIEKMRRAGADRVISPYLLAGRRMAALATHPVALDVMDTILHAESEEIALEEMQVAPSSAVAGHTIRAMSFGDKTGTRILAIKSTDQERINLNPKADTMIRPNDILILMGSRSQLELVEKLLDPTRQT